LTIPYGEDETGIFNLRAGGADQSFFLQVTKAFEFSEQFSARFSLGMKNPAILVGYRMSFGDKNQ